MTGDYVWWVDDDRFAVALDNGDGTHTALQTSGDQFLLYCKKEYADLGSDLGDLEAEDDLPAVFHSAIVDGAIADGYALPSKDKSMLGLFEGRFISGVARGQEWASHERVGDSFAGAAYNIFQVDA